jgi:hypothetical protein
MDGYPPFTGLGGVVLPRQSIPVDFSIMSVFMSNASPPERVKLTPVFEEDDCCLSNPSVFSPVYVKKRIS